jgi:hypothetical protein
VAGFDQRALLDLFHKSVIRFLIVNVFGGFSHCQNDLCRTFAF